MRNREQTSKQQPSTKPGHRPNIFTNRSIFLFLKSQEPMKLRITVNAIIWLDNEINLIVLQENANYEFLTSVSMKAHAFLESTGQGLYCNLWGQEKN